jgi:hypothetical protein
MYTYTEEDFSAAKLKGYHAYIKFIDGEIIFLKVNEIKEGKDSEIADWFEAVEKFLNVTNMKSDEFDFFPAWGMTVRREEIKYVKML